MATSTIGRATIGTSQTAATAVTGWASTTPCGSGILVYLPATNSGTTYYGFATGVLTTTGMPIPNGIPYTINAAGLCQGATATLANLFFISDTASQAFAAEAIG